MFTPIQGPFGYAHEVIEHIEEHNCVLGCKRAGTRAERAEFGPGGSCGVLAQVVLGDEPVPELDFDDRVITCTAREPLPERPPRQRRPRPAPAGQLTIGGPS